jgi:putative ABC transport system permease protein
MTINGSTIPLKIAGLFDANGSRGRYGFVSKAYLQSVVGRPGFVNAFYVHQASPALRAAIRTDPQVSSLFHVSKTDLESDSYRNAIKGTEIFQLGALFVVVISGIMLVHFYLVNAATNIFDASRLRALGLGARRSTRVLLAELWLGVTLGWLVGLALAGAFAAAGIGLLLTKVSVPINHQFPWAIAVVLYAAMLALGTIALLASTRSARQASYSANLSLGE